MNFNPKKHYLGSLCKRGHAFEDTGNSVRYKKTKSCVVCGKNQHKKYRQDNVNKVKEYAKQYYENNRERLLPNIKIYSKKYYHKNKDEINKHLKLLRRIDPERFKRYRENHSSILRTKLPREVDGLIKESSHENIISSRYHPLCHAGFYSKRTMDD